MIAAHDAQEGKLTRAVVVAAVDVLKGLDRSSGGAVYVAKQSIDVLL